MRLAMTLREKAEVMSKARGVAVDMGLDQLAGEIDIAYAKLTLASVEAEVGRPRVETRIAGPFKRSDSCVSCGAVATTKCQVDCGMALCGSPLCDDCDHVDTQYGWIHKKRHG